MALWFLWKVLRGESRARPGSNGSEGLQWGQHRGDEETEAERMLVSSVWRDVPVVHNRVNMPLESPCSPDKPPGQ